MAILMDAISVDYELTVTFNGGIVGGIVTDKEDYHFILSDKLSEKSWKIYLVHGARTRPEYLKTNEEPKYEIDLNGRILSVKDVRPGYYATSL